MWCRVRFVRIDISEDGVASILRIERISEPGTTFATDSLYSEDGGDTLLRNVCSNKRKILGFRGGDYEECRLLRRGVAFVRTDVPPKRRFF
jgi:hypothetical protein